MWVCTKIQNGTLAKKIFDNLWSKLNWNWGSKYLYQRLVYLEIFAINLISLLMRYTNSSALKLVNIIVNEDSRVVTTAQ